MAKLKPIIKLCECCNNQIPPPVFGARRYCNRCSIYTKDMRRRLNAALREIRQLKLKYNCGVSRIR